MATLDKDAEIGLESVARNMGQGYNGLLKPRTMVVGANREFEDSEVLVSRLRELGLRFLGPSDFQSKKANDLSMNQILRRVAVHGQPRVRLALIPLLILHPDLTPEVRTAVQQLPDPARTELQALYTAAV